MSTYLDPNLYFELPAARFANSTRVSNESNRTKMVFHIVRSRTVWYDSILY